MLSNEVTVENGMVRRKVQDDASLTLPDKQAYQKTYLWFEGLIAKQRSEGNVEVVKQLEKQFEDFKKSNARFADSKTK